MDRPIVFERGDHVYLVGAVTPMKPSAHEVEEFAFAKNLVDAAPNPMIAWMRGQYVEADRPNANGAIWLSDELAISSLTPRFMPVTVMHDPRTAVGMIADTKLLEPERDKVPVARIDTALALWAHRFGDVVEEAMANYKTASLWQSMECLPSHYECADCGHAFVKMPDGSEKASYCEHLSAAEANGKPARRLLRDPVFTGTGLIFGSRGAHGALSTAHLETFQEEIAELHVKAHERPRRTHRMDTITINRDEYDALKAAAAKVKDLEERAAKADEHAAKVTELTTANEKLAIDKKAAEDAAATEKAQREKLEETARASTLASERISKLGTAFKAKLPEVVTKSLAEQAKTYKDDEWAARLDELASLTGVKHDEGGPSNEDLFTREETARTAPLGGNGEPTAPSDVAVGKVVEGLFGTPAKPPEAAAK